MSQNSKNDSKTKPSPSSLGRKPKDLWYSAKVIHGNKIGRTVNIPTINLDNPALLKGEKEGVYAVEVTVDNQSYKGSLYFGPRTITGESHNSLEIYLFDFDKEIYGKTVSFKLTRFLRSPIRFNNLVEMKKTIEADNKRIKSAKI